MSRRRALLYIVIGIAIFAVPFLCRMRDREQAEHYIEEIGVTEDEDEAEEIARRHNITPERDAASYAKHFTYEDAGHSYELWYADKETLKAWIKAAADGGIERVSLWRLGGNCQLKDLQEN